MSLADKFDATDASCLHVSTCPVELIHMAKPVTEMERCLDTWRNGVEP